MIANSDPRTHGLADIKQNYSDNEFNDEKCSIIFGAMVRSVSRKGNVRSKIGSVNINRSHMTDKRTVINIIQHRKTML